MKIIIDIFLQILATYFTLGAIFGFYFVINGATKIDPLIKNSPKRIRFLLLPGAIAMWPFLIRKIKKSTT